MVLATLGLVRWDCEEAAAQAAGTDSQSSIAESYAAEALELRNLSGLLEIESGYGAEIEITLQGSAEGLAAVERQLKGDRLVVDGGSDVANDSVVVGSVSVFTTGGGSSQIIIGRQDTSRASLPDSTPLRTYIRVPRGLPVTIIGHRGDIVSGDLDGPLVLGLVNGVADLGQIRDARLSLTGDGTIAAREALGDLSVVVTGAGEVEVDTSTIERLEVGVTGAGAVAVGGEARFASLSLVGSGRIYLAEAERQPVIQHIGSGEVLIGVR